MALGHGNGSDSGSVGVGGRGDPLAWLEWRWVMAMVVTVVALVSVAEETH